MASVINSLLDNDLYKFTMQKAVLAYCPGTPVSYVFNNRRPEGRFNEEFIYSFHAQLERMADLKLTPDEHDFLADRCPFLGKSYLAFLKTFRFKPEEVKARLNKGELELSIHGPWESTILWEVPLMAMISELFFVHCDKDWVFAEEHQKKRYMNKALTLDPCHFADFGTRRRRSYAAQDLVLKTQKSLGYAHQFVGTSNVHFAHRYGFRPIGTMAHEWIMGVSALEGLRHANRHALKIWSKVFDGDLGIALTDTYGTDAFFEDFDGYLARLFDGVRHDSGDPEIFARKVIAHYKKLGIDPKTKTIVFSDGLNAESARKLYDALAHLVKMSFGIGTSFTNDFATKPLNMVIKMASCGGVPVVKISDVPTKAIGDKDALRVARWTFFGTALDSEG